MRFSLVVFVVWITAAVTLHLMRVQLQREQEETIKAWIASEMSGDLSQVRCDTFPAHEPPGPFGYCLTLIEQ